MIYINVTFYFMILQYIINFYITGIYYRQTENYMILMYIDKSYPSASKARKARRERSLSATRAHKARRRARDESPDPNERLEGKILFYVVR